ncbi:unnamed protein product [Cuscuta epithymum]|uniref:Uncharacterized protein n=1 Tax=Cuscuta epithymum TaxID=186058 RepID=A0AAV0GK27_9ASTE|nr:unnamed protein product [Cuscuta epithymum]
MSTTSHQLQPPLPPPPPPLTRWIPGTQTPLPPPLVVRAPPRSKTGAEIRKGEKWRAKINIRLIAGSESEIGENGCPKLESRERSRGYGSGRIPRLKWRLEPTTWRL